MLYKCNSKPGATFPGFAISPKVSDSPRGHLPKYPSLRYAVSRVPYSCTGSTLI
jgi:hypothetical protein